MSSIHGSRDFKVSFYLSLKVRLIKGQVKGFRIKTHTTIRVYQTISLKKIYTLHMKAKKKKEGTKKKENEAREKIRI